MNFAQPLGTQHASKIYTSSAFKSITVLHSANYITDFFPLEIIGNFMQELTPPENAAAPSISLTPPEPLKEIQKSEADQMVTLDKSQIPELDAKVDAFVDHVITNSVHSPEFQQNVQSIHNLGNKEIRESAQVSNRLLELPAKSINDNLFDNSPIAKSLTELRGIVEDLDPSKKDLTSSRKLFGLIPFGNKVGTSLSECTAISMSLFNIARSNVFVKTPVIPNS